MSTVRIRALPSSSSAQTWCFYEFNRAPQGGGQGGQNIFGAPRQFPHGVVVPQWMTMPQPTHVPCHAGRWQRLRCSRHVTVRQCEVRAQAAQHACSIPVRRYVSIMHTLYTVMLCPCTGNALPWLKMNDAGDLSGRREIRGKLALLCVHCSGDSCDSCWGECIALPPRWVQCTTGHN